MTRPPFPIVGIGTSAGGLEALEGFFRSTPADSGMAFVVVLSAEHQSLRAGILNRLTLMRVHQITDGMSVQANHVYVIAPGYTLTLAGGRLRLADPVVELGEGGLLDHFLRSLAEQQNESAIAVILSGTGTSGTDGAGAVKAAGGICIAQSPESASFPGMPRSLIAAGHADQVHAPADIPGVLLRYIANPYVTTDRDPSRGQDRLECEPAQLADVLAIIRSRTRQDFSGYRKSTLLRRIHRRMGLAGLTRLTDYSSVLREQANEIAAIANDLTINVTGFFRDPGAWEALRSSVIAPLCASKEKGDSIRAWVAGCASGEEA